MKKPRTQVQKALSLVHHARAACGCPHSEPMEDDAIDESMEDDEIDNPLSYLDELEDYHEELDKDDDGDYEQWLEELGQRYDELDRLEAVASDTEFMEACAEFGMADYLIAKSQRLADLKPDPIDSKDADPSLRRYLDERSKLYKRTDGAQVGPEYVSEVDDNAIDLKHTETKLSKACVKAAMQRHAANVDYPKALRAAQYIEGELSRLAKGKVRASVSYIALKGVRIKMRKLSGMLG